MKQIDRIRNMTAEELAEFLNDISCTMVLCYEYCVRHHECKEGEDCDLNVKTWLESEVEDAD